MDKSASKPSKTRAYFSLLSKVDGKWSVQFGDYDRSVVEDEKSDLLDSEEGIKLKIVKTDDSQAAIEAKLASLNGVGV